MPTDDQLLSDEEEFHSSYRVFLMSLKYLALPPDEQCAAMGDYNVAWELKDDVLRGRFLIDRGYLSVEQEAWVGALAGALEGVPAQTLPAGAGRDTNLAAMQHPSWTPLRSIAKQVLKALSTFTTENSRYLGLK
jgi:hypothetical protein